MPKNTKDKIQSLKVMPGNIIVEQILEDEEVNGLVKSVQYEDKAYKGRVVRTAISTISRLEIIREGCTVYFNKYSSTAFPFEGKEYLLLRIEDIIAYS